MGQLKREKIEEMTYSGIMENDNRCNPSQATQVMMHQVQRANGSIQNPGTNRNSLPPVENLKRRKKEKKRRKKQSKIEMVGLCGEVGWGVKNRSKRWL
jgi:hypothetical protein